MYIIVVGAGKVGWNLARELLEKEHEATLIESDRRRYLTVEQELEHNVSLRRRLRALGAGAGRDPACRHGDRGHRRRRGQHADLPGRAREVPGRADHRPGQQPPEPPPLRPAGDQAVRSPATDPNPRQQYERSRGAASSIIVCSIDVLAWARATSPMIRASSSGRDHIGQWLVGRSTQARLRSSGCRPGTTSRDAPSPVIDTPRPGRPSR